MPEIAIAIMSVMPADQGLLPGEYEVIYASDSGGMDKESAFVLKGADTFFRLWAEVTAGWETPKPELDPDSFAMVVWFPGEVPTPGYDYQLNNVFLRYRGQPDTTLFLVFKLLYRHGAWDGSYIKPVVIVKIRKNISCLPAGWWENCKVEVKKE
ncbi:MAG: hypothetical protein ABIM88_06225 [candidate division WOR-3 bacterium]